MTTWTCIATVEFQNNQIEFPKWKGTKGAAKLKAGMRKHFKSIKQIKHFSLGNCVSVNSYGAH